MTGRDLLRRGDRGAAVRDLRARLAAAGLSVAAGDLYDETLEARVREFQELRRLRVDGICGPETWGALIESSFRLGDRLLYLASPMLRGDDVSELQQQLNALGFDAGREDGILGPDTETALRQFQRNAGMPADGVFGPATSEAMRRVSSLAAGSVASVREREEMRAQRRLGGLRIFLVADSELSELAHAVSRSLADLGAMVRVDVAGDDPSALTAEANRFDAGVFVALTNTVDPGVRCAYFANQTFQSEGGRCLALRLTESLRTVFDRVEDPIGRTYRYLRETRMAAVVCELTDPEKMDAPAGSPTEEKELARALVEGIRRGVEEPPAAG